MDGCQVDARYKPVFTVASKDGSTFCGDLQRSNPWSAVSVLHV